MIKQITRVSFLVLLSTLLISCGLFNDAKISKTDTGNTLIVAKNFTAVILTKEFMESNSHYVHPTPPSAYWTPKTSQVLDLESKLADYVAQNGYSFHLKRAPSKEALAKYGRQYYGFTNSEEAFLIGSFFCPWFGEEFDWQNHAVEEFGGGNCFFSVEYDPETQEFIGLYVNSMK